MFLKSNFWKPIIFWQGAFWEVLPFKFWKATFWQVTFLRRITFFVFLKSNFLKLITFWQAAFWEGFHFKFRRQRFTTNYSFCFWKANLFFFIDYILTSGNLRSNILIGNVLRLITSLPVFLNSNFLKTITFRQRTFWEATFWISKSNNLRRITFWLSKTAFQDG